MTSARARYAAEDFGPTRAERSIDSAMEAMQELLNGSLAVRYHVDHPGTPLGARRHGLRTWRENSPAARGW